MTRLLGVLVCLLLVLALADAKVRRPWLSPVDLVEQPHRTCSSSALLAQDCTVHWGGTHMIRVRLRAQLVCGLARRSHAALRRTGAPLDSRC